MGNPVAIQAGAPSYKQGCASTKAEAGSFVRFAKQFSKPVMYLLCGYRVLSPDIGLRVILPLQ
jgi:hypothetical protein